MTVATLRHQESSLDSASTIGFGLHLSKLSKEELPQLAFFDELLHALSMLSGGNCKIWSSAGNILLPESSINCESTVSVRNMAWDCCIDITEARLLSKGHQLWSYASVSCGSR